MTSQTSELLDTYAESSRVWSQVYGATNAVEEATKTGQLQINQIADCDLILKHIKQKLEDATTEVNKAIAMLEQTACLMYAGLGMSGPIRGDLCTATVRTGVAPPSMKRRDNPELHDEIMRYFGFSQEAAETELARLHYPNVEAHLQQLSAEGKPLPKCLKELKTRTTFALTCRLISGVDLDERILNQETRNDPTPSNPKSSDIPF